MGDFCLKFISAVRYNRRGRASGGMLIGFKKVYDRFISFCTVEDFVYITIKSDFEEQVLVPIYLNCSSWERDMEKLTDLLMELNTENIMLLGDFNARTGTLSPVINISGKSRKSKDSVENKEGRILIDFCNTFALTIINGCSLADMEGEFTFVRGSATSVIDYCLVGRNWENRIIDFKIVTAHFSDHFP